jgi:hypothetical protein
MPEEFTVRRPERSLRGLQSVTKIIDNVARACRTQGSTAPEFQLLFQMPTDVTYVGDH